MVVFMSQANSQANRGYVQTSIAQSSKVAPQVAPADWAAKRQQQMENAKMLKLQREAKIGGGDALTTYMSVRHVVIVDSRHGSARAIILLCLRTAAFPYRPMLP
jgi:hypothetical protein